jgi:hypothetical protein
MTAIMGDVDMVFDLKSITDPKEQAKYGIPENFENVYRYYIGHCLETYYPG